MKFIRYSHNGNINYGILEGCRVFELEGSIYTKYKSKGFNIDISEIKLLSPVLPSKIISLGYNYKDLVGEKDKYDEPILFLKPNSSVIGPDDCIVIPENKKTWTEVELAIVIGKKCKDVMSEKAKEYIFGYTIGNDVTMENILDRDHHLARSKAWNTFCPIGPSIETELNTEALVISNRINDVIQQQSNTNKRILADTQIVSLVSKIMTLYPGDVILTGTPANAEESIIKDQDIVSLEIEGIGKLTNKVEEVF